MHAHVMCAGCIVADWAGYLSPFIVLARGVLRLQNTLLLDSHIGVEVVDVSFEGAVRMENVTFANVTLTQGAVVSTTRNDYYYWQV